MNSQTMTVLLTGAGGQLGQALVATAPDGVQLHALTRGELDIADGAAVAAYLARTRPALLINAAAYTAVDRAESEREAAFLANGEAPGVLARACAGQGVRLFHVSTDFVFDGLASSPYAPDAPTAPLGVYGQSKRAGEVAVQEAAVDALILRTGWVYGALGHNFMHTMLRLHRERDTLSVVADQVGTPTHARTLAGALWAAAQRPALRGIYHWSDAGVCSWYDFAQAIGEEARAAGLVHRAATVQPIRTEDYPTPARRPSYSVLDKSTSWRDLDLAPVHWREELRRCLQQVRAINESGDRS